MRSNYIGGRTVALLAGGFATRLGAITAATPKALLPVAGRPFIEHQLRLFRAAGVRRVVACVSHLGDQVERCVGDGRRFGLDVEFSHDGPTPLGTAGALRAALPLLGEPFWVVYGDSYTDFDWRAAALAFDAARVDGLMTVIRNDGRWDHSNVLFRQGVLERYDKAEPTPDMTYIDYGVSLLRREALARVPEGRFADLGELYRDLVAAGRMVGFWVPESQRFYEIGSPAGLAETREFLARRSPSLSLATRS
jgi:NDP-sugar pyrophosphorylase family protein